MGKQEGLIEGYLTTQAAKIGIDSYKWTSPGRTGVPDRILVGHGLAWLVETKTKDGKLSARQKIVHRDLKESGWIVFVLWSKEDVDKFINVINDQLYYRVCKIGNFDCKIANGKLQITKVEDRK